LSHDADNGGGLIRRDGEPPFAEPWQAEVMGVAAALIKAGRFSASLWSETLGAEIRKAEAKGRPDTADTYYGAALLALERLVADKDLLSREALARRKSEWEDAYARTPHGQPVTLG
jgi:nitrile hydratase accessory protein